MWLFALSSTLSVVLISAIIVMVWALERYDKRLTEIEILKFSEKQTPLKSSLLTN